VGADLFDCAAGLFENRTGLDRLEARGTLRLVLKDAGLDAGSLDVEQLRALFAKRMPAELAKRGVDDAAAVAKAIWEEIERSPAAGSSARSVSLDETFRRLGSG